MQTCSSRAHILRTVRSSCNFATDFFSTPRTTMSLPLIPTCNDRNRHIFVKENISLPETANYLFGLLSGKGQSFKSADLINWRRVSVKRHLTEALMSSAKFPNNYKTASTVKSTLTTVTPIYEGESQSYMDNT